MGLFSNEQEIRNDSGNPIPVYNASLPLPAGAATDASLTNGNAKTKITDSLGNTVLAFPYGTLQTEDIPTQLFIEPFNGSSFDTINWVAPTASGGGVVATVSGGQMTLGSGTTAGGYSKLYSNYAFPPTIPGWIGYSFLTSLPDGAAPITNAGRLWGAVNPAATPAPGALAQDAAGFELHSDGKLYAVVYAAGVRTVIQDLSAATGNGKQPTDAMLHRYIVRVRTDRTFFYIDGLSSSTLVATASNVTPVTQNIPIGFVAAAGTTPASSAQVVCQGAYVWDTAKNNRTSSDGTYPWRKAKVTAAGEQVVAGGQANAGGTSGSFTFTAADIVVAAPDGQGTLISGTPTTGSITPAFAVADGLVGSLFLIKGLATSQTTLTIYFEGSGNSTNGIDGDWVELKQRRTGTQPGVESADYKTVSNGYFRGNCADFKWLRARIIGTFTGTPSAQIWTSAGQGATFFNSGLVGSSSAIGNITNLTGVWDYRAGASGSPRAFTGKVIGIAAHATTAGSFTINGGDSIPVPANSGIEIQPVGNLVSPTLSFSGTDSYFVEVLN